MKQRIFLFVGLILSLLLLIAPAQAQDENQNEDLLRCDSTLITLLLVAQTDYGYEVSEEFPQLNFGQFTPFFTTELAQGDTNMQTDADPMAEATEEADMMTEATEEADVNVDEVDTLTQLPPGTVEREDVQCQELRADLETFFFEEFETRMGVDNLESMGNDQD